MARRIVATYSERHLALFVDLARVVVVVVVFSFCCRFSLIHRRRERDLQSCDAVEMVDVIPVESVATLVSQRRDVEERNRVQVLRLEGRQELGEGAGPFLFVRSDRIEAVEGERLERVRLDILRRNEGGECESATLGGKDLTAVPSETRTLYQDALRITSGNLAGKSVRPQPECAASWSTRALCPRHSAQPSSKPSSRSISGCTSHLTTSISWWVSNCKGRVLSAL